MTGRRLSNLVIVIVFAAGIAMPFVQQAFDILPPIDVVDNRPLAPFPPVAADPEALAEIPARLDTWYADHMGLRGHLVAAYRWLTDSVLRSPDKVIIGQDGWLYLRKGVREDIETVPLLRDWCGRFGFSDRELREWVAAITANHEWLAARGIDYLFVVPPNKMTVVPDHLPGHIQCRRGTTRLQQLESALRRRSGIDLVNLTGVLRRSAGAGEPIWFRTDTHWNARGVAAAYAALMDRIVEQRPAARRIRSFRVDEAGTVLGDLGRMLGTGGLQKDTVWSVRPADPRREPVESPFSDETDAYGRRSSASVVDAPDLPRAMVFHDSYFDGPMNEYLAEAFARSVFVFHGRPEIDRGLVEQENPDIVIQEMVERNLLHPFFPR